jgi:hypothetical protein
VTTEEARAVAEIMVGADGSCVVCGAKLLRCFNERFPGFKDVLSEVWAERNFKTGRDDSWEEE